MTAIKYNYKDNKYNSIYDLSEALGHEGVFIPLSLSDESLTDLGVTVVHEEAPITEEQIQAHLTQVVQNYMDTTVQTRGYDNIHTACTYASSTDETFKAEGTACVVWRDTVWRKCYDILAEVKAGTREIPTEEELISELPKLEW